MSKCYLMCPPPPPPLPPLSPRDVCFFSALMGMLFSWQQRIFPRKRTLPLRAVLFSLRKYTLSVRLSVCLSVCVSHSVSLSVCLSVCVCFPESPFCSYTGEDVEWCQGTHQHQCLMISPSFPRCRVARAPARGRLDGPQWYECTTRSSVRAVSYWTHGAGHLPSYGGSRTVCNGARGRVFTATVVLLNVLLMKERRHCRAGTA